MKTASLCVPLEPCYNLIKFSFAGWRKLRPTDESFSPFLLFIKTAGIFLSDRDKRRETTNISFQ